MNNAVTDAFKDLAQGAFKAGLRKLETDNQWHDDEETLDGPFYLGFPGRSGWGEALFLASLLKRYATYNKKHIKVFAQEQPCSILKDDRAFRTQAADSIDQCRCYGARSPLALLRHALLGELLDLPFKKIDDANNHRKSSRTRPLIGIAWASVEEGKAIPGKSLPVEEFLRIIDGLDVEVIVFQRKLQNDDVLRPSDQFSGRCSILPCKILDAKDQAKVARRICELDCMVTISTTTTHIAASLDIPVVLLAAKRRGPQWFWRAQKEHGKLFYPQLEVVLGGAPENSANWWEPCLEPARHALLQKIGMHPQAQHPQS